jgi:hypothetical protein
MTSTFTIADNRLTGRTPNDGAHRLAHWLKGRGKEGWVRLRNGARLNGATIVDRVMTGELVPQDDMAMDIARETEGEVLPADWQQGGGAKWEAEPAQRLRKAA